MPSPLPVQSSPSLGDEGVAWHNISDARPPPIEGAKLCQGGSTGSPMIRHGNPPSHTGYFGPFDPP